MGGDSLHDGCMDDLDRRIIDHLVRDGRAGYARIAADVGLSAPAVKRRVDRLVADGVVKGYPMNGTIAPWRTSFYGMYGRSVEFGNHHPFDLPEPYMKAKDKIDMSKFVNFVSTNDIIGGNSGSPIINTRAEVVGLVFDGNIESLPNRYLFRDDVPRTVNVHPDAIIESLKKVYDAGALADELLGKPMYR